VAPVRAVAARSGRESPGESCTPFGLGRFALQHLDRDDELSHRHVAPAKNIKVYIHIHNSNRLTKIG
jgi:hypothetical protein